MKRRTFFLILALAAALVLCCAVSGAMADAKLRDSLSYSTGVTTISWDVSGSDPGSFKVYVEVVNNGAAKQMRINAGTTSAHTITTMECIPDKEYEVILADGNDNILDRRTYRMPAATTFMDGKLKNTSVKISLETRRMELGKDPKKVKALKAQEIIDGLSNSVYYGVKYQMRMPTLAKTRDFFVTLAFEAPNGFLYVDKAGPVTFDRVSGGYQTVWWKLAGAEFFLRLYLTNLEIPAGQYTTYLYWDGMWVNTSHFKVT